jgi:hypothetical protein
MRKNEKIRVHVAGEEGNLKARGNGEEKCSAMGEFFKIAQRNLGAKNRMFKGCRHSSQLMHPAALLLCQTGYILLLI